jgi:uncharacterized protein YggE
MSPTTITIPLPTSRAAWLAIGLAAGLLAVAIAPSLLPGRAPALQPGPTLAADASSTTPEHTNSVSGTGKVVISPDIADVRLGVSVTKPTVAEARSSAASIMTAVIDAIRKAGVADADLKTSVLSLSPAYDYPAGGGTPRLKGYTISNAVVATIRSLETAGAVIDGAMAAGATTMDGITFRVADPARAEEQARQAAMAQAKSKAQTLATAAGVAIEGVATISESSSGSPYPIAYSPAAGVAKDAATPVQAGTNEVTVTVTVVYLIP